MKKNNLKSFIVKTSALLTVSALVLFQGTSVFASGNDFKSMLQTGRTSRNLTQNINSTGGLIDTKDVLLNSIGLQRVNEARKEKGLLGFSSDSSVEFGQEVLFNNTFASTTTSSSLLYAADTSSETLPSFVDNSKLSAFPPIGSQNYGDCGAYATTYYQMTHMVALEKGWDAKNGDDSTRFSPRWSYNLTSGVVDGTNGGTNLIAAFNVMEQSGALTLNDFPYYEDPNDPRNYLEWPTTFEQWNKALKYKVDKTGYVDFNDSTSTPITDQNDEDLASIKKMLSNGYILTFTTYIDSWIYTGLTNDPNTTKDDAFTSELICYMKRGNVGPHAMTIVGYSDDVWFDINCNNIVDRGEKGAFKVANSYGTEWKNKGYVWLAYDALNDKTSIEYHYRTNLNPSDRDGAVDSNKFYWFTVNVREDYTPALLAEFTLNHTDRSQVEITLGYSNSSDPDLSFELPTYFTIAGNCAFDGTQNTACDATIVIDLTDFNSFKFDNPDGNWFLKISDRTADGLKCKLLSYKLIDNIAGKVISAPQTFPVYLDGTKMEIPIYNTRKVPSSSSWSILIGQPVGRPRAAYATLNDILYVIGGIGIGPGGLDYVKKVDAYDTKNGTCTPIADTFSKISQPKAFVLNGKIYVAGTTVDGAVVDEYNESDDLWTRKITIPSINQSNIAVTNGKIYFMDGATVEEYDPVTGTLSHEASFPGNYSGYHVTAANGRLYVLGGNDEINFNIKLPTVWEYDPVSDLWTQKYDMPYAKSGITSITLNNKIYVFSQHGEYRNIYTNETEHMSVVEEYDPDRDSWIVKDDMLPLNYATGTFDLTTFNNKILLVSSYNTSEPNSNKLYAVYSPEKWSAVSSMPVLVAEHASTTCNNKIYIVGGIDDYYIEPTNTVQVYDPLSRSWTIQKGMNSPRNGAGAATLFNKVYAFGGFNYTNRTLNSMEMYDEASDTWIAKASMPTARHSFGTAVVNDKLYVVGGIDSNGNVLSTVEEYDPVTNKWSTKMSMPTARNALAVAVVDNKIYAIGGDTSSTSIVRCNIVEEFDPSTNTWTTKASMPTNRDSLAAASINGKIYAIGGSTQGTSELNIVEEFDPLLNTWTRREDMPTARNSLSTSVVNQKIYATGGWDSGFTITGVVEEFNP